MPEDKKLSEEVEGRLKLAYWLAQHKKKIKTGLIISLLIIDIFLIAFGGSGMISYFLSKKKIDKAIEGTITNLPDFQKWREKNKVLPLRILVQKGVFSKKNTYDFIALIENPNQRWASPSFRYRFIWDSGITPWRESFILPAEKKYLLILNQKSNRPPLSVQLQIQDIDWELTYRTKRLSPFSKEDFKILQTKFIPQKKKTLNRLIFKVKNESAYNFWEVPFTIVLYQGKKIVGGNYTVIKEFLSQETREVELAWRGSIPHVSKIEIEPEINVFKEDIFMPVVPRSMIKEKKTTQ